MEEETRSASPETTPSWSPDPYRRHELRYWDGFGWTEQVSDQGTVGIDDPPAAASPWAAMTATAVATPSPSAPPSAPATAAWDPPAGGATTSWTAPAVPPAASWDPPPGFDAPGAPRPRRSRRRVVGSVLAGVALVVALLGVYGSLDRPERIDAGPPAATPAGYRVVETDEYRIAVPGTWASEVVTAEDRERVAEQIDDVAPGAGAEMLESSESIEGTQLIAVDPVSRENVQVVRFEALRGDPRDADVVDEIQISLAESRPGLTATGLQVVQADVHGFPAAKATYTLTIGSTRISQASTVVQTGDHVYLISVSTQSAARAEELSGRIVPTFDPV